MECFLSPSGYSEYFGHAEMKECVMWPNAKLIIFKEHAVNVQNCFINLILQKFTHSFGIKLHLMLGNVKKMDCPTGWLQANS